MPPQPYLRRRDVYAWLDGLGVQRADFEKLVDAKVIERITLRKNGRGYYLRSAIERHLVEPFRAAEGRLGPAS